MLFLTSFIIINAQEQVKDEKRFALSVTIGNGFNYNIQNQKPVMDNIFYSPAIRLLWEPNHLLNIGVETGYLTISKQDSTIVSTPYGQTIFKARLNAIPLLLVFNMKVSKINLYYGLGVSYLTTHLQAFDEKVVVGNWYYCYNVALAYNYPLSKNVNIGIEAKSYFFPKLQTMTGGVAINLNYKFLHW